MIIKIRSSRAAALRAGRQWRYKHRFTITYMTKWAANAKEFRVSITHNVKRCTSYNYIPKPILAKLGNPKGLKFVIQDDKILVTGSD